MMTKRHLLYLASLSVVVCLMVAACGGTPTPTAAPQATSAPQATEAPAATAAPTEAPVAAGPTLRWAVEGVNELPALDPPLAGAAQSVGVINLVFEGLVRLDGNLEVAPAGAETWDILDGGKTFVFHLRKDLKFANGDPVTAEDFAYSLNRAFAPEFANGAVGYYLSNIAGATDVTEGKAETISGVKVIDPMTLEIDLNTPATYFLDQLTFAASFVVPKNAIEADPTRWTDRAYGTGPFMVREWKHNQSITLAPNPNYWAGQVQPGAIELTFFQDAETAYKLYQTGGLDIMGTYDFPTVHIPEVANLPDFHQVNQFFVAYIGFNNAKAPFNDVRVKQAFAKAVDKTTLIEKVLEGALVQADTIIPPGMPGFNKNAKVQSFDAAAAKQLLSQAGYPDGRGFPRVAFSINNENPNYSKIAAALQQMWKENLGVDVDINTLELAKFNDDLTATANNPEAPEAMAFYLSVWGADYPDPQNFVSQQLRTDVGNNNGHYSNAQFDALVDQADVGTDPQARYKLYQQAEQIALDEVGWLPLYYGKANLLLNPKVKGLVVTPQGLFPDPDWTHVTLEP